MARLKIALIGLGRMGRVHAAALAESDVVEVVAIADPSTQALDFGSAIFPNARTFANYLDAFSRNEVQGCIIASPTFLHPAIVSDALDSGIHVLCEKPLGLDLAVAEELINRARSLNLILQVGHWRRFSPPWAEAKRLVDAGEIGQPLLIRLSQWDANPPPASFCDSSVSGGLAIDCGVHEYDLAEWLFGSPVHAVRAWNLPLVDQSLGEVGDVDNLCAVLEFSAQRVAFVDLSRNSRYGDDVRTEILGSEGAIFVNLLPHGRTRLANKNGTSVSEHSLAADPTAVGVARQIEAFAEAAKTGSLGDNPGGVASARSTRIGFAVIEAARRGERIEV